MPARRSGEEDVRRGVPRGCRRLRRPRPRHRRSRNASRRRGRGNGVVRRGAHGQAAEPRLQRPGGAEAQARQKAQRGRQERRRRCRARRTACGSRRRDVGAQVAGWVGRSREAPRAREGHRGQNHHRDLQRRQVAGQHCARAHQGKVFRHGDKGHDAGAVA